MKLRHEFLKKFDDVLQESGNTNKNTLALLVVRFRDYNEIITFYGFQTGEIFLKYIEDCLNSIMRPDDVVAKVGEAEFGVLLPNLHNPSHVILAVNRIINEFKKPLQCGGQTIDVHAVIGVVIHEAGKNNTELLQNAYQALLQAEKKRTEFALYELAPEDSLPPNLVMESEISHALSNDEFSLFYQPKYNLLTECSNASEALIRWVSPKLGAVNTQYFIDVLEKSDLLTPVTKWVLNQAISQLVECQKLVKDYAIAVNLSPALFTNDHVIDLVISMVNIWGIDPSTLILEVTESAMMENPELSLKILRTFNEKGIRVSIDDFGTGYSSLSYLQDLPADELKIDMSFVKNMTESPRNRSIATSTIQLSHNLGMQVTAEGIENRETMDLLIEMGCDTGQGYYLDRPMPFKALLEKISS